MTAIPLFFQLEGKEILIVGGGISAAIKLKTMLSFTNNIRIVALELSQAVADLAAREDIEVKVGPYLKSDLKGVSLVFAAAKKQVNDQVHRDAKEAGILCCKAEGGGDFLLGATAKEGDLTVAVSTNGKYPMLAKKICQEMDMSKSFYLDDLEKYRRFILARYPDRIIARQLLKEIADAVSDPLAITKILERIGYEKH